MLINQIKKQLYLDLNYTVVPHYRIAKKKHVESDQKPDIQLRELEGVTESFDDYQATVNIITPYFFLKKNQHFFLL